MRLGFLASYKKCGNQITVYPGQGVRHHLPARKTNAMFDCGLQIQNRRPESLQKTLAYLVAIHISQFVSDLDGLDNDPVLKLRHSHSFWHHHSQGIVAIQTD